MTKLIRIVCETGACEPWGIPCVYRQWKGANTKLCHHPDKPRDQTYFCKGAYTEPYFTEANYLKYLALKLKGGKS